MSLTVSLVRSNLPSSGGKFRAVLHTGKRRTYEQLLQYCEKVSTVSAADVEATLSCMVQWLLVCSEDGRECDLGQLGRSRLGLKGLFDQIPDQILDEDVELSISWVFPPGLRKKVRDLAKHVQLRRIVPDSHMPVMTTARTFLVGTHQWEPDVWQAGSVLHLRGARLKFDSQRTDEGVFLIPRKGRKTATRVEVYQDIFPRNVRAQVPYEMAGSGAVDVEVRRRWPAGSGNPLRGQYRSALEEVEA